MYVKLIGRKLWKKLRQRVIKSNLCFKIIFSILWRMSSGVELELKLKQETLVRKQIVHVRDDDLG